MRLSALALLVATAASASAQAVSRTLTLVPEVRFDVGRFGQARDVLAGLTADGRLIATTRTGGDVQAFDSTGKTLGWKLASGRRNEAEIAYPTAIGWLRGTSTAWITDVGFRQVALIDPSGKVVKSIEHPSWIHPHWAERRKYPVFASMEAVAMYPDHSMLIIPDRERSLIDVTGYDRSVRHLLRISASGAIEQPVATLPGEGSRFTIKASGCAHVVPIPFGAQTEWAVSGDGSRIVIVTPTSAEADSGTYRVTVLGERGDTLVSRRYPQPVQRITPEASGQFLGSLQDCGSMAAAKLREQVAKRIPAFRSFVTDVAVGGDGTMAVTLHALADSVRERTIQLLDARGEPIGTTQLPFDQAIAAVSHDRLWVVEPGKNRGPGAIVRYRLDATAARPSRSVPVSSSSRPSRPPA